MDLGEVQSMVSFFDHCIVYQHVEAPLLLTIIATPHANIGLLEQLLPRLCQQLEGVGRGVAKFGENPTTIAGTMT